MMSNPNEESRAESAAPRFRFPPVDRFEEWLHAPAPLESTGQRFDIRRATPAEFDAIFSLVDETFGSERSRAHNDWLYRRNPFGIARCWVVFDRDSGRMISSGASWPWPVARGTKTLDGTQEGDTVVAPGWQRQGVDRLRNTTWRSHAWFGKTITMGWPNEKTRGSGVKRGNGPEIVGPIPKTVLILNSKTYLAQHNWPAVASAVGGLMMDTALSLWRKLLFRPQPGLEFEPIRRFDSSADEVTERCMQWPALWTTHAAAFLNWRYLGHPTRHYRAFALVESGKLAGYYVLKLDGQASWLMEFVAPVTPGRVASALLLHAIETALAAECTHVNFSAPPKWRHWKLFHTIGFLPVPSHIYFWTIGNDPELTNLDRWQWVPGDMDWV